jgi:tRNA pseudouridine38-40 synthase
VNEKRRIRLRIAYHGGAFHGWQRQPVVRTVEGDLTAAITHMTRVPILLWGASRTDAGVHAGGQVAVFETRSPYSPMSFYKGINHLTESDVAVLEADEVSPYFHPRHDARGKVYRYWIADSHHVQPMHRDRSWHHRHPLDEERMHEVAQQLVGHHDFSSFRAAGCEASSPIRELYEVSVRRTDTNLVCVQVAGSAFLRYMVRAIVGTLVEVGRGCRTPEWFAAAVAAKVRSASGPTAPPHGLSLERVFYPDWPWASESR